jgi:hypothetical protein
VFPAATTVGGVFDRVAGASAIGAAIVGLLYSYSFVVLHDAGLSAFFLLAGGVLTSRVLVAIRARFEAADQRVTWGFALALAGSIGAAIHGGYDLANVLHPPADLSSDLPNAVDPRGILTFGATGIGLLALSLAMWSSTRFPRGLAWLGLLSALLSVSLYLGRLIILSPASPAIALPAVVEGFVVNPVFYLWMAVVLLRDGR